MLRTDLLELINGGRAWAFVGSGVSADAGSPTWAGLVERVVRGVEENIRTEIIEDTLYRRALESQDYSRCFSRIQAHVGRNRLEVLVRSAFDAVTTQSQLVRRIADWPFAGYITTNYDRLLANALNISGRGWIVVGNTDDEARKVSGGASNVIWHIHGATSLGGDRSRLILTSEDYDDLYLEEGRIVTQLRTLMIHTRVVFIGFGFRDPEVTRLLRRVGRFSNPARPVYAFMSGLSGSEHEAERQDFFHKFNVDIIPYQTPDNDHSQLLALLEVYSALTLRRSLRFNQPERPCPSYDPETTGLLLYNELALRGGGGLSVDKVEVLLRATILPFLSYGPRSVADLLRELEPRIVALTPGAIKASRLEARVESVLQELVAAELVTLDSAATAALTEIGRDLVANQSATAARLSEQFASSLVSRATELHSIDGEASTRIARAAESFFKQCIERRALGVALAMQAYRADYQSYHMVALLQALPDFMDQLPSPGEAMSLSKVVQGVLARPTEAEAKYIGLALQARFGVNILGYDADTLRARARDIADTLFLVDSHTLIPFLARSSPGFGSARLLIERLRGMGSAIATTTLLVEEVAEHARWAMRRVDPDSGFVSVETLRAATGRVGNRSNAFLDGFLEELSRGAAPPRFAQYLGTVCALRPGARSCSSDDVKRTLEQQDIVCAAFAQWKGFSDDLFSERDHVQGEIAKRREERETFRHERQVRAEAEALLVVRNLRARKFTLENRTISNAYFLSHTRVVDEVAGPGLPITMRPEAALQWVATLAGCGVDELALLTNGLVWELSERGVAMVDTSRLHAVFSPLVAASKEKLEEEVEHHRALIAQRYGEDAEKAFRELNELDVPIVLESYYAQRAEELAKRVADEERKRKEAQVQAKMSEKDAAELRRLRAEQTLREGKKRAKRAAAKNKRKRKRRR